MTEPTNNTRRHSAQVVDGPGKAASRAMLLDDRADLDIEIEVLRDRLSAEAPR